MRVSRGKDQTQFGIDPAGFDMRIKNDVFFALVGRRCKAFHRAGVIRIDLVVPFVQVLRIIIGFLI